MIVILFIVAILLVAVLARRCRVLKKELAWEKEMSRFDAELIEMLTAELIRKNAEPEAVLSTWPPTQRESGAWCDGCGEVYAGD